MHYRFMQFLWRSVCVCIFQRSAATNYRWSGKFNYVFVGRYFLFGKVKELLKSDSICKSYAQMKNGPVFYSHAVYVSKCTVSFQHVTCSAESAHQTWTLCDCPRLTWLIGSGYECSRLTPEDCNDVAGLCDVNAQCLYDANLQRYDCQCNRGFEGDGRQCTRVGKPPVLRSCHTFHALYESSFVNSITRRCHFVDYCATPLQSTLMLRQLAYWLFVAVVGLCRVEMAERCFHSCGFHTP